MTYYTMQHLMVPTLIFLLVVAPLWIVMHYRQKRRSEASLTQAERADLERLADVAESLRDRVATLESILDAETPGWRGRTGT